MSSLKLCEGGCGEQISKFLGMCSDCNKELSLKQENAELKAENAQLKAELENIVNFAEAKKQIMEGHPAFGYRLGYKDAMDDIIRELKPTTGEEGE